MTIQEAVSTYGKKQYVSSKNETLLNVVDKIYQDRHDIYFYILVKMNTRYDWFNIKPNSVIYYLDKKYVTLVSEIISR